MDRTTPARRRIIQLALLVALIALGFALHRFGMEHEVLLDNQTVVLSAVEFTEIPYARLVIDGDTENPFEFEGGDRDISKLVGPTHHFRLEVLDEDQETVLKTVERTLSLGTKPQLMLSLPALLTEHEDVFIPTPQETADAEEATDEENNEQEQEESEEPHALPES